MTSSDRQHSSDARLRKQAEQETRRSEENFRLSLDNSPLGVRIVTIEGETLYANKAILDIYGYDNIEELKTIPVKKRYTPESYAEFEIRRENRRQGINFPIEYIVDIVRNNGEVRHLQVFRKEILWDGKRQFQVIYNDITERMRVEKALCESEERYRTLFSRASDGISILSADGNFVEVNESFARMHGYSTQEMLLMNLTDLVTPETLEFVPERMRRLLAGESLTVEVEHYQRDGHVFLLEVSASLIYSGGKSYIQCFHRDITARKRAQEALRRSEERHRTILETAMDGFWMADLQGCLLDVNETYSQMSGYSLQELLSMHIADLEVVESATDTAFHVQKVISQGEDRFESQHRRKDGSIFPVEISVQYRSTNGGRLVAFLRDITEHKLVEEALAAETHQLEETNAALRVLLQRLKDDQQEIESKITNNIRKLVLPSLENLRNLRLNDYQTSCLDIVAANLHQVTSPFLQNLTSRFVDFTPREIQVANMIREGRTSKEIADIFNSSIRSVDFHRDNIRKKLGLSGKKTNLRAFLMNLSDKYSLELS